MPNFPEPGKAVRGSHSGAPLMALFDLLGRRWALGVIWQLSDGGPASFRGLQARCEGVSPTVLNSRLKELRHAGLIERGKGGYRVTAQGLELFQLLAPLRAWSHGWADDMTRG